MLHVRPSIRQEGNIFPHADVQNPSSELFKLLHERFLSSSTTPGDLTLPPPFRDADKYLLASLVQKAIRRGDLLSARRAGHQLLECDPARLWRRLRTIALEDIGIGDSDIAAELVAIASHPELRRVLGGTPHALDHALERGCRAVKDRTPDHLHSVVERAPDRHEYVPALRPASDNALVAVVASAGADWIRRAHANAILHERHGEQNSATRQCKFAPLFEMFGDLGAPELLLAACQVYLVRERDALPLHALLAWSLHATTGGAAAETVHTLAQPALIDGIPDYAFDPHHTRTGRRAVELWRRSYLTPPRWTARQVGMALWNIEAASCDRRLKWPLGEEIRRRV